MIKLVFNLLLNAVTFGWWERRLGEERPDIRVVPQYRQVDNVKYQDEGE